MHRDCEKGPLTAVLQTPPGKGGVAVIALRGGGRRLPEILRKIFRSRRAAEETIPEEENRLVLGYLLDGEEILDEALLVFSPRGAEINIHGGPVVARRVLRRLTDLGAVVGSDRDEMPFAPAHPRWRNPAIGRELQAVLPDAPTPLAAAVLTNQWSDGISRLARECLDAPHPPADATERLASAAEAFAVVQRLIQPPEVVLAGPPNAGKSTLMNLLVGRPVSIVHEQAGTTRDWVREPAVLSGRCVFLTDTAGLWQTADPIDAESVRRAWRKIASADLVLLLSDADGESIRLPPEITVPTLRVRTKCDLLSHASVSSAAGVDSKRVAAAGAVRLEGLSEKERGNLSLDSSGQTAGNGGGDTRRPKYGFFDDRSEEETPLSVSAHTGCGIPVLIEAILRVLGLADIDPASPAAFTERQAVLLRSASDAFRRRSVRSSRLGRSDQLDEQQKILRSLLEDDEFASESQHGV